MKSIINKSIIIISTGILFSLNSFANTNENPKTDFISNANKTIKEHIVFSTLAMDLKTSENVNVVFTVNETGQVNLVIANTKNEILKQSIESQFKKLKLNHLIANNAYSVVFNFKTK